MRLTSLFAPTLKDDPADAEVVSHKLLVRAGMIRQVARGIYDYLPLGLKVLRRVEKIVREELDRAGCQEILMPAVCPAGLWQESGRWDQYGKELLRLRDRNDREFCFGPTHEEVVTDLVRGELRSYRDLPKNLYQVQTKFRDEVRPRFGLMRGREFLMKDGYSFHADRADAEREYHHMYEVYERIFRRCGLEFRAVEADTGSIGGSLSHEFQVLASSGEDEVAACNSCDYAANVEKAELRAAPADALSEEAKDELKRVSTPGRTTIEEVSSSLSLPFDRFIKTLIYVTAEGKKVAALVRGDHQLSEAKLRTALRTDTVTLANAAVVQEVTGAPVGFAGPIGLEIPILADQCLHGIQGAVSGANAADEHLIGVSHDRDFGDNVDFADLHLAVAGDACPRCENGAFEMHRGIEVGQVFYLGTKYSKAMGATILDQQGKDIPLEMGCYGIGISRTLAAAVEQSHDEHGIIWPLPLAPYAVQIVPTKMKDDAVRAAAETLYKELIAAGVDVLLDDRDERPGVKFKDADLIGTPLRVTIGPRGLEKGIVELRHRKSGDTEEFPAAEAVAKIAALATQGR
ncbi:MAG: proline--tRNA ligase [Deltaproteobacteria bacterium]